MNHAKGFGLVTRPLTPPARVEEKVSFFAHGFFDDRRESARDVPQAIGRSSASLLGQSTVA